MIEFNLINTIGNTWEIRAPKGYTIIGGFVGSQYEAECWCRAYISSWQTATYKVISQ